MLRTESAEVIVVGGGMAGLSAAIYLGRAERDTLVIDAGKSMARWEPDVENYLGFPGGIAGPELLQRGRKQMLRYGARQTSDEVTRAAVRNGRFVLRGKGAIYKARKVLLAPGIFHLPPAISG